MGRQINPGIAPTDAYRDLTKRNDGVGLGDQERSLLVRLLSDMLSSAPVRSASQRLEAVVRTGLSPFGNRIIACPESAATALAPSAQTVPRATRDQNFVFADPPRGDGFRATDRNADESCIEVAGYELLDIHV